MDLSSFGSFQTYQWRPGEFLDTSREFKWITNNALIQEEPPDPTPLSLTEISTSTEHLKSLIQVSNSSTRFVSHNLKAVKISSSYPDVFEKRLCLLKEESEQNSFLKMQVEEKHNKDNSLLQNGKCLLVYFDPMTVIIHFFYAKGVDNIAGTKEEPPDLEVLLSYFFARTGIGVVLKNELNTFQRSTLVEMAKGERMGVLSKALKYSNFNVEPLMMFHDNINHPHDPRGKFSMVFLFDGSNLILFVAVKTDLRTNPFQLGEDDVISESSKDIKHGAWKKQEAMDEHGAKEANQARIGLKTRFGTKYFHKEFRVSLHLVNTQEDHLDPGSCIKSTTGHDASPRWLELGHMIHSHSFSLSSVLSQWVFRVRFLMRLVAHMFIYAIL